MHVHGNRHVHARSPAAPVHHAMAHGKVQVLGEQRIDGGVVVVPELADGRAVTPAEMQAAIAALQKLPAADLALVARNGVEVHLYNAAGVQGGLLGATTVVQDDSGRWKPTIIRVAVGAGLTGTESIPEIVQHEFGHAVSVLRNQDRSEAAAIAYAQKY